MMMIIVMINLFFFYPGGAAGGGLNSADVDADLEARLRNLRRDGNDD